jgi:hypothetical protein
MEAIPKTADDVRELLREYLPRARAAYVGLWEQLGSGKLPLAELRARREKAVGIADGHESFAAALRGLGSEFDQEGRTNAAVLAEQLERLAVGLRRMSSLSPHALKQAADIAPKAVGCGNPKPTRDEPPRGSRPPARPKRPEKSGRSR